MNLSELLSFLEQLGKKPSKGLSQNFLIEKNIVTKIVGISDISHESQVLEIGPGAGTLTQALLDEGAKVFAIEKDRVLSRELERLQTSDLRLCNICADFLDFDLKGLPNDRPLKVVANLPYSITTPILEKLLAHHDRFSSITIMVQKEVAERMVAQSGCKQFSSLSLFLQFYTTCHSFFLVSASCFYPRPKVDSTVIRFDLRPQLPMDNPGLFFRLSRRAFQQRRKMITTSLKELYPREVVAKALEQAKLRIDARPEALCLEEWIEFVQIIETYG